MANETNSLRDSDIRLLLLEHLTVAFGEKEHFLAMEARYAASDRRADVLAVSEQLTYAYEIKSDVDRLGKLAEQLADYRKTFDFVTVVTTPIHLKAVRNLIRRGDGLICVSENKLNVIRTPKKNAKIVKRNMIHMCSKSLLAKILDIRPNAMPISELRELAEKQVSLSAIRDSTFRELSRRFKGRYDAFLKEACLPYQQDDLFYLQYNQTLSINFS